MVKSSWGFRLPPRSARSSASRTGFTPEKDGLPRRPIMSRAASVSSSRRRTSSGSVSGVSASARRLASALTACSASSPNTRGSSSVRMDFSNSSVMLLSSCAVRFRQARGCGPSGTGENAQKRRRLYMDGIIDVRYYALYHAFVRLR